MELVGLCLVKRSIPLIPRLTFTRLKFKSNLLNIFSDWNMEAGMMWQNVISQIERHSATYWWKLKREYSQVLKRFFQSQEKTSRRKKSVRKVSASDQIASGVLIKYFSKQMAVCRFSCTQCKSFTAPSLHWESLLETSASMQKHENKSHEKVVKNNWETTPLKKFFPL